MHGARKSTLDTVKKMDSRPTLGDNTMTIRENHKLTVKKVKLISVTRENYRELEKYLPSSELAKYRIKGERGGLMREYSKAKPDCPLTLFVESMGGQTQWTHKREDGTMFHIRINGANEKEDK